MATITATFGSGGSGIAPQNGGTPAVAGALRDVADDFATFKTKLNALITAYNATLAKLDADAAVGNGAGTYAATNPGPAAVGTLLTIKG